MTPVIDHDASYTHEFYPNTFVGCDRECVIEESSDEARAWPILIMLI